MAKASSETIDDKNELQKNLFKAAITGNIEKIKELLEKGVNINDYLHNKNLALNASALMGRLESVEFLLANGAEINKADAKGQTALHKATIGGYTEIVEFLLKKGALVNSYDIKGATALHTAMILGDKEIVTLLIEHGADINKEDNQGQTALHKAIISGDVEVVEILLKAGADKEKKDAQGITPLSLASILEKSTLENPRVKKEQHSSILEILLKAGADPRTISEPLFSKPAPANPTTREEMTGGGGSAGVLDLLEEAFSAESTPREGRSGDWLSDEYNSLSPESLTLEVNRRLVVSFFNSIVENKISHTKFIISIRPDLILSSNDEGVYPLLVAVYNGNKEIIRLFLDIASAEIKEHECYNEALTVAESMGHHDIVKLLSLAPSPPCTGAGRRVDDSAETVEFHLPGKGIL
jgi:ankyrin repeat protein